RSDTTLERHPWIAQSLVKAFEAARKLAFEELFEESALRTMLPFQIEHVREMIELMGDDPWAYGLAANRDTLSTFLQLAVAQGLAPATITIEDLVVPSTLDGHRL